MDCDGWVGLDWVGTPSKIINIGIQCGKLMENLIAFQKKLIKKIN